jgi:hypothetical protein
MGSMRKFRIIESRAPHTCEICSEHIPQGEPHKVFDKQGRKHLHACSTCDVGARVRTGSQYAREGQS